jgi:hypothetical protein
MDAGADLERQRPHRFDHGKGAPHRRDRTVEGCEEAVPGGCDLPAAEAGRLAAAELVVLVEHVAPASVSHLRGERGRVHDVGEQQRGQHPIRVGARPRAGEELLDLIHQAVDALRERQMVGARQLDELRALNRRRGARDCSTGTIGLPIRLSTSVGVRIDGRTSATSAFIV